MYPSLQIAQGITRRSRLNSVLTMRETSRRRLDAASGTSGNAVHVLDDHNWLNHGRSSCSLSYAPARLFTLIFARAWSPSNEGEEGSQRGGPMDAHDPGWLCNNAPVRLKSVGRGSSGQPRRLALISDNEYLQGGQATYVRFRFPVELPRAFPCNVHLFAIGRVSPIEHVAGLNQVTDPRVHFVDIGNWTSWSTWLIGLPGRTIRVWRALDQVDAVIVKLFYLNSIPGFIVARLRRKPTVVMMVGDSPAAFRRRFEHRPLIAEPGGRLVTLLTRTMMAAADENWIVSNELRKYCPRRREPIVANESTVLEKEISKAPRSRPPGGGLLFVGRLEKVKNLGCLLRAMHALQGTQPVRLTLVGDGSQRRPLERQVNQLGLAGSVCFAGHVSDRQQLLSLYQAADILVLPSLSEGLPLVLLEAMAQGLPCVASGVGGVPELVQHERTGLLFQPDDDQQLAMLLRRLYNDRDLYEYISRGALETARANTVDNQLAKVAGRLAHLVC